MPRQILLQFQTEPRFESLRENLSALQLAPGGCLWLASDELSSLERLQWDGRQFDSHESFDLTDFFDLPAGAEGEVDIEGLSTAGGYLWLAGSQSRKIRKPRAELSDAKNLRRLTWDQTRTEPNRYLLGRVPLVDGRPVASCPDPERPGEELTAAALSIDDDTNALVAALEDDPHLGPYVAAGIPGKANGLDVEGLECLGDRLLLGLRGPVLLDWAVLLEVQPKEKRNGRLALRKVGPDGRPYQKYFVNLQGLGVRDLCRAGDDLLILAGPTQYLDGPAKVFLLRRADVLENDVMYRPELLFEIPCGVGTDHPEGITLAADLTGEPSLLVVYDAPNKDRRREPNGVLADVFPLPASFG